jgi:hypothetical protein
MPGTLLFHKEPPLAWITFNRPEKRNAISLEMWQALPGFVAQTAEDNDIHVLLIRGAGEEAFISGADISQFGKVRSDASTSVEYDRASGAALSALANLEKPVVAMIQGICFGGGCSVAVMCDLRLCSMIPLLHSRRAQRLYPLNAASNASSTVNDQCDGDLVTARVYSAAEASHGIGEPCVSQSGTRIGDGSTP